MMALGSNMGSVPSSVGNNHRVGNGLMPEEHRIPGSVTCRFAGRTTGLERPSMAARGECWALRGGWADALSAMLLPRAIGAVCAAETAAGGKIGRAPRHVGTPREADAVFHSENSRSGGRHEL